MRTDSPGVPFERADSPRSRRALFACAALSAAVLATVTASAASATGTSTSTTQPTVVTNVADEPKHTDPPKGAAFAIAYKPTANAPGDVNAANKRFAACMREQGQEYFPDFHAAKDDNGRVRLDVKLTGGPDFDPASDGYQDALDECAPILEKAGITFPEAPDLPPLPERLERPDRPGHPGGLGEDDGPSLNSSIENA